MSHPVFPDVTQPGSMSLAKRCRIWHKWGPQTSGETKLSKNSEKPANRMKLICLFLSISWFCLPGGRIGFAASNHPDISWTERVISDEELLALERSDSSLDMNTCREILARLNNEEAFYIRKDIRQGRELKVPRDFNAYRDWTPMPVRLPEKLCAPKLILVVKDIAFIGWYESGVLVGDSQACTGVSGQDTRAGCYRVEEKDAEHTSSSYPNDFGSPAWMPFSLHIYEAVWIHAGPVFGAHCSHGCVILPIEKAEALFRWAEPGTPVFVVEQAPTGEQ